MSARSISRPHSAEGERYLIEQHRHSLDASGIVCDTGWKTCLQMFMQVWTHAAVEVDVPYGQTGQFSSIFKPVGTLTGRPDARLSVGPAHLFPPRSVDMGPGPHIWMPPAVLVGLTPIRRALCLGTAMLVASCETHGLVPQLPKSSALSVCVWVWVWVFMCVCMCMCV